MSKKGSGSRRAVLAVALAITVGPVAAVAGAVTGEADRVHLFGSLTLDGTSLDADFLGAVVLRNGLVSPCQATIPSVAGGKYDILVFSKRETAGCGTRGARIALWTYVGDTQLFTTETFRWPGNGKVARFDATFSSDTPNGASPPVTVFQGEVYDGAGDELPGGTRVEAFIDGTRCGVGSVRRSGEFTGYIIAVVGPDAVLGCALGATIEFRVKGVTVDQTAVNGSEQRDPLDLVTA